jgi:uncharacterized phage protein (TIGR02216 family)
MATGLGVLGLAPDVFWRMTPKELDAALRGRFGAGGTAPPLTRTEFDQLMQLFPDDGGET